MTVDARFSRVVLRAPNWLGDAVLAIPAMAAVRASFPDAHITLAAPPAVAGLFRENTPVAPNDVLELPSGHGAAIAALRAGGFDLCLLFPNSFRSAWQTKRAGINERWGYAAASRSWLLTRAVARSRRQSSPHQSAYYSALVRELGFECDENAVPSIAATARSAESASALLQKRGPEHEPFAVVLPGAAYGQAKQWPPDRMAELCARLVRERGLRCLLLGAAHDKPASREIESWLRAHAPQESRRVVDLVGRTDLAALVGLLARATVCISNDSGGMHVAAALGRPVVAIFGPTDERVTRPVGDHDVITEPVFCRPCMLRDCPIDHRCMKRITVDRVFSATVSRLTA